MVRLLLLYKNIFFACIIFTPFCLIDVQTKASIFAFEKKNKKNKIWRRKSY